MSEELREKICRFCFKYVHNNRPCGCLATQDDIKNCEILLKNVKQWAKGCVPEVKKKKDYPDAPEMTDMFWLGYNLCREKTLRKMEEK